MEILTHVSQDKCSYIILSVAYRNRKSISIIERVVSIYIYIYISRSWRHILRSLPLYIEIYRVCDNRRAVNTSSSPHISDQLGSENACQTLLCWFIIMIWILVCNNMCRYERHFGSFSRNPTILETVSIARKWQNGPHSENIFVNENSDSEYSSTDVSLLR